MLTVWPASLGTGNQKQKNIKEETKTYKWNCNAQT